MDCGRSGGARCPGLFGQLVEVGNTTSRVLLIIDKDFAVPVQVNRNGAQVSLAAPVQTTV